MARMIPLNVERFQPLLERALSWYDSLYAQSIVKFKQFKKLFIGHFMTNKRGPKKMTNSWSIIQGHNETLNSYIERFTAAYSFVAKPDEEFVVQAYIVGLSNESMKFALGSSDIFDMHGFIARAYKLFETLEMSHSRAPHPQYYD